MRFTSDDANDPVRLDSVVLATAETLARRLRLEERSTILEVLANEGRPHQRISEESAIPCWL